MQTKKISRFFQGIVTRIAIYTCLFLAKITADEKVAYGFAHGLAKLAFAVAGKQRRVAFESLKIAFGQEKSQQEIEQIAFDCFGNMAKMAVEFMMFLQHRELIDRYIDVQGLENLDRALAKGNGVVALSAHFGNFPMLCVKLALKGYKIRTVLRVMRDPWVNKYFQDKRDSLGVGSVYTQPRERCVRDSLETLRNKEILFIQLDQNFGTGGIFVDFFGRKAATAKGTIVFALRSKAPIVPMFIYRGKDNKQTVVIEPEVRVEEGSSLEETIQLNAQKLTYIIETHIRRSPAEWGWIHKRWKARPKEERKQAQILVDSVV